MGDDRISALRATAHPLRLRMLSLLTGTAMSASEVARALDVSPANASYHLRQLLAAGELVEAGEVKIRGGVAKRYRYPHERVGAHQGQRPSVDEQVQYARALAAELERRLQDRAPAPEPGDPSERGLSSDLDGWVAPEVWERAAALLREASHLLHDANQPPGTEGTVHVSFTGWTFRMGAGE